MRGFGSRRTGRVSLGLPCGPKTAEPDREVGPGRQPCVCVCARARAREDSRRCVCVCVRARAALARIRALRERACARRAGTQCGARRRCGIVSDTVLGSSGGGTESRNPSPPPAVGRQRRRRRRTGHTYTRAIADSARRRTVITMVRLTRNYGPGRAPAAAARRGPPTGESHWHTGHPPTRNPAVAPARGRTRPARPKWWSGPGSGQSSARDSYSPPRVPPRRSPSGAAGPPSRRLGPPGYKTGYCRQLGPQVQGGTGNFLENWFLFEETYDL